MLVGDRETFSQSSFALRDIFAGIFNVTEIKSVGHINPIQVFLWSFIISCLIYIFIFMYIKRRVEMNGIFGHMADVILTAIFEAITIYSILPMDRFSYRFNVGLVMMGGFYLLISNVREMLFDVNNAKKNLIAILIEPRKIIGFIQINIYFFFAIMGLLISKNMPNFQPTRWTMFSVIIGLLAAWFYKMSKKTGEEEQ